MVFSSAVFLLLFLPVVFVVNLLAPKRFSNVILLAASLCFYAWGEPVYVLLMLFSVVISWAAGLGIAKTSGNVRKLVLTAGILADLGLLGYYKYAGFAVRLLNALAGRELLPVPDIALPIGISFFTFQAVSYLIDVYRGEAEGTPSLVNVALYISFFPQLIAGPIVKYREISRQIEERSADWRDVASGFRRFIYGLGKKVLIANVLGLCVDRIYAFDVTAISAAAAWAAALAYPLQIYYDFSGYSDMAIGLGKMFGFTIPENFDYPYLSRSISEYWRRWHISLGSWFRDYVYIPLGGNRKGKVRTYVNLGLVFFLTGLWHGANYSYVLWGMYHGFFAITERLGFGKFLKKHRVFSYLYTDLVLIMGFVLFRAEDTLLALRLSARMFLPWRHPEASVSAWAYLDAKTLFVFAAAVVGAGLLTLLPQKWKEKWTGSVAEALYLIVILVLSLAAVASNTYNPFIYFQF